MKDFNSVKPAARTEFDGIYGRIRQNFNYDKKGRKKVRIVFAFMGLGVSLGI